MNVILVLRDAQLDLQAADETWGRTCSAHSKMMLMMNILVAFGLYPFSSYCTEHISFFLDAYAYSTRTCRRARF